MAIKRYIADADNTITDAFRMNLDTRATASNQGLADSLEVFNIYAQATSASVERARILIKFPMEQISTDRTNSLIPASGSVKFYLNMYNVKHSETLPKNFNVQVYALSQSWNEGRGVDMDEYQDLGQSNWVSASTSTAWVDNVTNITGGLAFANPVYTASFVNGDEDMSIEVTPLVEQWIAGTKTNYGFLVKLSSSLPVLDPNSDGGTTSLYTKRFSARGSEFFFKRPAIEARWDSRNKDDRANFYYSSSLAPAEDNLNTLFLYNVVRGRLQNIPAVGTGTIFVSLYSGSWDNTEPTGSKLVLHNGDLNLTGGHVSTGVYTCSVGITASAHNAPMPGPLTHLFDVWHDNSGVQYFTGSIRPIVEVAEEINPSTQYVLNVTNLKPVYYPYETGRFRLFTRQKNWNPTIYTKTTAEVVGTIVESSSYAIVRTVDNLEAIPYGTGSDFHTFMSYDKSGSYFDLDMSLLEPGYQYKIKFAFYNGPAAGWQEQPYSFKFRVEEV